MFRVSILFMPLFIALAGCQHVRVEVDCRLTSDQSLHRYLNSSRYVIRGVDEESESSLAFEEFSAMFAHMLSLEYTKFSRVSPGERADISFTLAYSVMDRGMGVESYPVYGHHGYGWYYGPGFRRYGYYGAVGTEVETVHLGYLHNLFVSAWIADKSQPSDRRVIWEGNCDLVSSERSLKLSMPYLMAALGPYYGRATESPVKVKFDPDDDYVRMIALHTRPATKPAD